MTLLYQDARFLQHDTGRHPENFQRLVAIHERLTDSGLPERCQAGTFTPLSHEDLAGTHAAYLYQAARELCAGGGGYLDGDTPVSADSCDVALAAAGACAAAVDAVL